MRSWMMPVASALLLLACSPDRRKGGPTGPDEPPGPDSTVKTPLVIEEIASGNVDFLDERGEDPGWVEIANVADSAIPLGGWRLRGEDGDGPAWRLPDSTLPPGGRMLIFLSGLDRRVLPPPGDTLPAFTSALFAWSDSMASPPGPSSFSPWEFPGTVRGFLDPEGTLALSVALHYRDYYGTALEWSEVSAGITLPYGSLDLGDRDRMLLKATFPEGQILHIRLCEKGQPTWMASTIQVVGTGRRLDTYDLSLRG